MSYFGERDFLGTGAFTAGESISISAVTTMEISGIWEYYSSHNTPLPAGMQIGSMAVCAEGQVWVEIVEPILALKDGIKFHSARVHSIANYDGKRWRLSKPVEIGLERPLGTLSLYSGHRNHLWISFASEQKTSLLCCFNGREATIFRPDEAGLPSDWLIWSGVADADGRFWVAMGIFGLYYYNGIRWQEFEYMDYLPETSWVTNVSADRLGRVWFAVQTESSSSFFRYDGNDCMLHATAPIGYQESIVQAIGFDSHKKLWVGWGSPMSMARVGLWTFEPGSSQWIQYTSDNSALVDEQIRAIAFDRAGRVWVASMTGLTIFNNSESISWGAIIPGVKQGPVSQETAIPHIDNAIVRGNPSPYILIGGDVVADSRGHIWTTSTDGVAVFLES